MLKKNLSKKEGTIFPFVQAFCRSYFTCENLIYSSLSTHYLDFLYSSQRKNICVAGSLAPFGCLYSGFVHLSLVLSFASKLVFQDGFIKKFKHCSSEFCSLQKSGPWRKWKPVVGTAHSVFKECKIKCYPSCRSISRQFCCAGRHMSASNHRNTLLDAVTHFKRTSNSLAVAGACILCHKYSNWSIQAKWDRSDIYLI